MMNPLYRSLLDFIRSLGYSFYSSIWLGLARMSGWHPWCIASSRRDDGVLNAASPGPIMRNDLSSQIYIDSGRLNQLTWHLIPSRGCKNNRKKSFLYLFSHHHLSVRTHRARKYVWAWNLMVSCKWLPIT